MLLATLVALDERVRGHAMRVARGLVSGEIGGAQFHETAAAILAAAQTAAHVPLTIFAVVAAVLVLCMTRMSWR
ncbi:MAG: hypothetical protein HY657_06590 [Acidobacteria bacterium]|nr:hypothetical protein [Acidobacteriota bacterium]